MVQTHLPMSGAVGEAAGALVGEDLAQRPFVRIGHGPVGEDVVEVLVLRVAGLGAPRPFVLVGGVVEDEIDAPG